MLSKETVATKTAPLQVLISNLFFDAFILTSRSTRSSPLCGLQHVVDQIRKMFWQCWSLKDQAKRVTFSDALKCCLLFLQSCSKGGKNIIGNNVNSKRYETKFALGSHLNVKFIHVLQIFYSMFCLSLPLRDRVTGMVVTQGFSFFH